MPQPNDKQLSNEIATRLGSESFSLLLDAARNQSSFTPEIANDSAVLRKVLSAFSAGTHDTLRPSDWQTARDRAVTYIRPPGAPSGTDAGLSAEARLLSKVISARLALASSTSQGPVWEHPHRDAALKVLESFYESFYDSPDTSSTLDLETLVNGASAIGEFGLCTGDELALVEFLEQCKASVSGDHH